MATLKVCTGCKRELESSEFCKRRSSQDGLYWHCRSCKASTDRRTYLLYRDRILDRNRARSKSDEAKAWRSERRRSEKYKESLARRKAQSPDKFKARSAIGHAIERYKIKRQPCEICGTTEKVQAHHHAGYEKENWLNVIWLCFAHHREVETT